MFKGDLIDAGLRSEDAEEYAKAGCKNNKTICEPQFQGKQAEQFIKDRKNQLIEITPEQQKKLFDISYEEIEKDVKRISEKEKVNGEEV